MHANPSGTATNLTATSQVYKGSAQIVGFYVNSTTAGTIAFSDSNGSNAVVLSGTITPAVGWHAFPASIANGVLVTIGATLDVTIFWTPA